MTDFHPGCVKTPGEQRPADSPSDEAAVESPINRFGACTAGPLGGFTRNFLLLEASLLAFLHTLPPDRPRADRSARQDARISTNALLMKAPSSAFIPPPAT